MLLTPDDGPFTANELIEIAYHYYPRLQHRRFDTADEDDYAHMATPQYHALSAAHKQGVARLGEWKRLVDALEDEWPDHLVKDMTAPYSLEPAYVVMVGVPEWPQAEPGFPEPRIMAMVSMLAPVYYIYESRENPIEATTVRDSVIVRHTFSPAAIPMVNRIEREIATRYGYHRIDSETGDTIVHGILAGNLTYGEVTLVDALLSDSWW